LGIPEQIWQERRKKIADTIESLRDEYRPALREGWMAYIKKMYSSGTSVQQGALTCSSDGNERRLSKMTWSQVYTFCCLICGNTPVEKNRDLAMRKNIAKSAAPFALSTVQIVELECHPDTVVNAYLLGVTKGSLQKLRYYFSYLLLFLSFHIISIIYYYFDYFDCFNRYTLWGVVHDFLNNKVFLKPGLRGIEQVQTHLGLTGPNKNKSIMDMYLSIIFCFQAFPKLSNIVYPCSWGGVYDTICPIYVPNFEKTKQKKDGISPASREHDNRSGPLEKHYDANVHEALVRFRMLDGSYFSEKAGQSVNFFTEKGKPKCWVKKKCSS